ncbi:unnamed protein product [Camellia sinensis]
MRGMREIGLMGGMMGMGLRAGREVVGFEDSIGKVSGMVMEFIGFIQGMLRQGSGVMDRAMVLECRVTPMEAVMLVNSRVESSTAMVLTILDTDI